MEDPQKKKYYIPIENELAEQLALVNIPGNEMRIIWVVWRNTWGWKEGNARKDWDWISLSQFEKFTKMKRANVVECVKSLVVKRLLLKGDNGYKFNKNYLEWVVVKRLPPVVKSIPGGSQKHTKSSSQKTTHKRKKKNITNKITSPNPKSSDENKINFRCYLLASHLFEEIKNNNPAHKPVDLKKWAGHVDKMIRLDGRSPEGIDYLIHWTQKDSFWAGNILSTEKLREQFDQLTIKVKIKIAEEMKKKEAMKEKEF